MFCKHCISLMKRVMRFENSNSYRLYRCPKCHTETKPKRFFFEDEEIRQNNTNTNKSRKQVKKPANKPPKKNIKQKRRGR